MFSDSSTEECHSTEGMKEMSNLSDHLEPNLHFEGVFDIDPKMLAKFKDTVHIVDVRQPEEFNGDLGHIPGAQLLVLDELPEKHKKIPTNTPIVCVCRSGSRSARAVSFLNSVGIIKVYNLKGGMLLWNELHLPTQL